MATPTSPTVGAALPPPGDKRILPLDGIRGVAILLVLVYHYLFAEVDAPRGSLLHAGARLFGLTWSGVDLFFVLSGFLIAGILLDQRSSPRYFRAFYLRRVCRIFPIYFLLLAFFYGLAATPLAALPSFRWFFQNPCPFWSYATFTQNILMSLQGDFTPYWLGVTWSLAVEEQYYLVVPLLVYFLPRRALVWVFVLAILAAPGFRLAATGINVLVSAPGRADSILAGALLAILVRREPFLAAVRRHRPGLVWGFAGLLAGTLVLTRWPSALGRFDHSWLGALYTLLILLVYAHPGGRLGKLLAGSVLVWFGQLSYGIYLLHEPVSVLLYAAIRHTPPRMQRPADAAITLLALGITLAAAAASFRFIERPILRLGHRFTYRPDAPPTPTP